MRKILLLTLILLVCAAWVVAQQDSTSRTAPGNSSQAPSQASPSSGQATPDAPSQSSRDTGRQSSPGNTPSAGQTPSTGQSPSAPPSAMSQAPAADSTITEGCLGGSSPNFTITDKNGTTYKLDIPKEADTTPLNKHIGESVQVMGAVNNPSGSNSATPATGSAAPGSSTGAAAASQASIQVTRIGRGTGTCAGSTTGAKPPAK